MEFFAGGPEGGFFAEKRALRKFSCRKSVISVGNCSADCEQNHSAGISPVFLKKA
jgi:hypothetical protein